MCIVHVQLIMVQNKNTNNCEVCDLIKIKHSSSLIVHQLSKQFRLHNSKWMAMLQLIMMQTDSLLNNPWSTKLPKFYIYL